MNRELESLIQEASVYSVSYSPLRRSNKKWETQTFHLGIVLEKFRIPPKKAVQIVRDIHGRPALIVKTLKGTLKYLYQEDFIQRVNLKRDAEVVKGLYALWTLVNPNHLKVLPKRVYRLVHDTAVAALVSHPDSAHSERDFKVDVKKGKGIVFSAFFDALFELIDNQVRTRDLAEYAGLVFRLQQSVFNAPWFAGLNTNYSVIEDSRPCYHAWMLPYLLYYSEAS